uniref:Uncharacterized protein n=1 Tax=Oryza meridionalis TaxID=40149 RepID=A0A0E0F5Y6_9ORYZ
MAIVKYRLEIRKLKVTTLDDMRGTRSTCDRDGRPNLEQAAAMGQPYRELGECCLVDRQWQSEAGGVGRWKLPREKTGLLYSRWGGAG